MDEQQRAYNQAMAAGQMVAGNPFQALAGQLGGAGMLACNSLQGAQHHQAAHQNMMVNTIYAYANVYPGGLGYHTAPPSNAVGVGPNSTYKPDNVEPVKVKIESKPAATVIVQSNGKTYTKKAPPAAPPKKWKSPLMFGSGWRFDNPLAPIGWWFVRLVLKWRRV